MKPILMFAAVTLALMQGLTPVGAQHHKHRSHTKHHKVAKPKNEITKLERDRKTDHTVRQITPDPKKSPGKHADNLSKNINHEINRESKDFNHALKIKK